MKDLVLAGQWRHWDVAILCQAAEELEQPEGWKPISFKFHNRSSAMHALVYSFKAQKLMLIPFLVEMAKRISFQWKGAVSKVERLSRGLATMASMKNGTVKYSWIDTIQNLKPDTNATLGDNLKMHVFNYCTEHADKIHDWKNTCMSFISHID